MKWFRFHRSPNRQMNKDTAPVTALSCLWLLLGAGVSTFVGWKFNIPLAAWIAPVFLIRFFRDQRHWYAAMTAVPALGLVSFIQLNGGWDIDAWMVALIHGAFGRVR